MTKNPLPQAKIVFAGEPVNFRTEAAPILADLVVGHLRKEHELSGRNGSSYVVTEVGQVTHPLTGETYAVTEHDYGMGVERECTCAEFDAGRPCQHVRAYEAAELAAIVAA